jgi:hypothetical protein
LLWEWLPVSPLPLDGLPLRPLLLDWWPLRPRANRLPTSPLPLDRLLLGRLALDRGQRLCHCEERQQTERDRAPHRSMIPELRRNAPPD